MHIEKTSPSRAVDTAFLQETIAEKDFEQFRSRLLRLLNHADEAIKNQESEEHLKGLIKPFLNNTNFGEGYYINTKERQDLAIHNGKTGSSSVGVILEAKRPSNKEMITVGDLNRKAFHESIFYYLQERIENGNEDIKHVIITDVYRWFVFDAQDFERYFFDSKKLKGWYNEWKQGQKVSSKTQFVYDHLSEFIGDLDVHIKATQFDVRDFKSFLEKDELNRDELKKLVPVFKFFTPTHLLKLPFASDSNNLNKGFYRELLYIMGLQEYKEKGTHYITRLDESDRNPASLIENTITQLKSLSVLSQISNRSEYGENEEEQLFNVAIQLLITWINRILFLKLLEAQLHKYHRQDERFRFLSHRQIAEYDELNKLFFQVLAVPDEDRTKRIRKNYGHIPYLNSSLFDVADIERAAVRISELEDGLQMPVHSRSKIRNKSGERLKGESMSALEYLLRFLDAYNFNTEGTAEVQPEAKTLINASVLGRIFEKINGYKDGSFFTPGYITEYMCRETIRRAVVQKFNEEFKDWDCESIEDVRSKISRHEVAYAKANAIVNSTTICDPAVGSGHFLVSALNELIAIKHDLRIFVDANNERFRDVEISVDHDELSISVGSDPFFEYRVQHEWKESGDIKRTVGFDTQRLQKALFREKNILIENCLFGVDINPNSVNICRLRLWVELLKHAYYKESPQEQNSFQRLEVLPNIDINIKQGNSLVSRFGLDADISQILAHSKDLTIAEYKQAVQRYKNPTNKHDKAELKDKIKRIKKSFTVGLEQLHPERQKLKKLEAKFIKLETQKDMFGDDIEEGGSRIVQIIDVKNKIEKQDKIVQSLENASFYDQAFEWRIEFPEVLNDDGDFTGFDVVIGNPPYGTTLTSNEKQYLKERYYSVKGNYDVYSAFIELGYLIGKIYSFTSFITPVSWLTGSNYKWLREHLKNEQSIIQAIILPYDVFEDAYIDTGIYLFQNKIRDDYKSKVFEFHPRDKITDDELSNVNWEALPSNYWENEDKYEIIFNPEYYEIKNKALGDSTLLEEISDTTRGILANDSDVFEEKGKDRKRYFIGDLYRYIIKPKYVWINYGDNLKEKPSDYSYFKGERLLIRRLISRQFRMMGTITSKEFVNKKDIYNVLVTNNSFDPKYILALINSKLFSYLIVGGSSLASKDDFSQLTLTDIRTLPIKKTNNITQKSLAERASQILTTKEDNPNADTSELEEEIDQLVYELYGLSEEEIGIVEGV